MTENPRCLFFACGERQDGRSDYWWRVYGTCCRDHAEMHYGDENVE